MSMEGKAVQIINEGEITPESPITIHINYNESLTLKELSDTLARINTAINDVNREFGIKSNAKLGKEYAAEVAGVDSGSIVVYYSKKLLIHLNLLLIGRIPETRLSNVELEWIAL